MKIKFGFLMLFALMASFSFGQSKYSTKTGQISFHSDAKLEKIEATNKQVTAVLTSTGAMEFALQMKGFVFEKALMQAHFNENYVESDKFPKASFKGKVTDMSKVNLAADGSYPVDVTGKLTIHGVTQSVSSKGTITVAGGKVSASSTFNVNCSDYGVKIESGKADNVSNTVKIKVNLKSMAKS